MNQEKWQYLRQQSIKNRVEYIRCDGDIYRVTKENYPTGPSPLWSIDKLKIFDIPDFSPEKKLEA